MAGDKDKPERSIFELYGFITDRSLIPQESFSFIAPVVQ